MSVLQFSQSETMRGNSKVNGSVESKFRINAGFSLQTTEIGFRYYDHFYPEANQLNGRSI